MHSLGRRDDGTTLLVEKVSGTADALADPPLARLMLMWQLLQQRLRKRSHAGRLRKLAANAYV